ncbi:MAG: hypothetical protein ACE5H4_12385 [Candidatus Thorarchaeota archaeon]
MDHLLKKARALYKDRERIALSSILVVITVAFFLFYSLAIVVLPSPPEWFPIGIVAGMEVVASFNTLGFLLTVALMILAYGFWSWAFLPSPAVTYTVGVLRGILGPNVVIRQSIGKRFRIFLEDGTYINLNCKIKDSETGEWFTYQLVTSPISGSNLEEIALRHGMSFMDGRFTTRVSNDELHHRILLLARAISLAH